jgi:hypothetical protein
MMGAVLAALKASLWGTFLGRCLAAVLAGFVALKLYGLQQQRIGAERVVVKIEQKAKDNAKAADTARARSLSGAGGVRDPYQRVD